MGAARHNRKSIDDVQKRYYRAEAIFFCSMLLMPLGLVCPCGLAMYGPPALAPVFGIAGLLLPFVGLGGVLLMLGDRSRYRRALRLARLADELDLAHTYRPRQKDLAFADPFLLFSLNRAADTEQGYNLLRGEWKGLPLQAVDYSYASPSLSGENTIPNQQSVAVFTQGFKHLPNLIIAPQTWMDRMQKKLLGSGPGKGFKVPGEEEFSSLFLVAGMDRKAILECLSEELIDLFLEDRYLSLEVRDGMLLLFRRETIIRDSDYEEWLRQAGRVAKLLRQA